MGLRFAAWLKLLLVLGLTGFLATSSFSHAKNSVILMAELEAYVLAGSTLGDICSDGLSSTGAGLVKGSACLSVSGAVLPSHISVERAQTDGPTRKLIFVAKRIHRIVSVNPARLTRAPPHA